MSTYERYDIDKVHLAGTGNKQIFLSGPVIPDE